MALTKAARSKIASLVQQAKSLLMKEVEEQLQQYYGIRPDGTVLMIEQLPTADSDVIYTARLLRQRLDYMKDNLADKKNGEEDAVRQLVREQAFTILNRFASFRMAEERGIISETIRQEYNSEGFQVFDSITGQGQTAPQYIRYKWYLYAIFDELALDLPAVFDRYSPYALVFPSEPAMNRLLAIINREDVTFHREEGLQAVNLWKEDETIGWIYQYYNSREEITAMREASGAPRNSQELAVRNQFFTPRYVVQFLSDNSLGRIWYEMTGGNTVLKTVCPYLIIRPGEVFLKRGESPPEGGAEEAQYIEYRPIKDPREILMLDPACGSMHFGLYCFDLFEHIYLEAWDNYPELLTDLRNSMTRADFVKQVPELIIRHNIHGVDIDPRALQIAGLSLWLRAQKSFDKQALPANQRPQITRSNLVLAEPMPGSVETLSQVVQPLEPPMRKLVLAIWDKMKLAGETGLLLKMEEEIDQTIKETANELGEESLNTQLTIGVEETEVKAAERAAVYATKQYRDKFLDSAEAEVLKILKQLSESATEGDAYQKLLFAEDTARGFAFIELCRKKYDVVLMNPPFGAASAKTDEYIDKNYPKGKNDLAAVFVERMHQLIAEKGLVGAITTRTLFFITTFKDWRKQLIIDNSFISMFADFGFGVLDALVETCAYIIGKREFKQTFFIRATNNFNREKDLLAVKDLRGKNVFVQNVKQFKYVGNSPLCYWIDKKTLGLFIEEDKYENDKRGAKVGLKTFENERFVRNFWEVKDQLPKNNLHDPSGWLPFIITDESQRFILNSKGRAKWYNNGNELRAFVAGKNRSIEGESTFFSQGLSWAKRTARFEPHIVPKGMFASSNRFISIFESSEDAIYYCGLWNSKYFDYILKLNVEWISRPQYNNGLVNQLPYPMVPTTFVEAISSEVLKIYNGLNKAIFTDETSNLFEIPVIDKRLTLTGCISEYLIDMRDERDKFLTSLDEINRLVFKQFKISEEDKDRIQEIISNDEEKEEGLIFNKDKRDIIECVFSWLIGCGFGRWDVRFARHPEWLPIKEDIFSPLPVCSPSSLIDPQYLPASKNQIVSEEWLAERKTIENKDVHIPSPWITHKEYPIPVLWDGISVVDKNHSCDLMGHIRAVIREVWQTKAGEIEDELSELLGVRKLEEWLNNPNKFFNSHLNQYTQNKRIAPIYWPISTPSGSYTIWIYYPNLTDQTLYKVISDFIIPKKEEVAEQTTKAENTGKKETIALKELLLELGEMEKDLLAIAALPYKPNHDDGVLITAAPLYKFFRHSKWRVATEACWKGLEKGEYDWAHLAYSIWPERVTKKCKKDLSMAIAQGLEEICEVKPKEKKEKKAPKQGKKSTQGKLINE